MDKNLNTNSNSLKIIPSNFSLYVIGVGILVTIITTFLDTSKYSLNGIMIGYSVIVSGYLILLTTIINNTKNNEGSYIIQILKTIVPFIIIIGTIMFLLYNIGKYFNNISNGRVSKNFKTFTIIFSLLTLIEILVFYKSKFSLQFKLTSTLPIIFYWILIFIGVIQYVVAQIISIDLAYFNTDG
jgi:hypothetical protein